MNFPILESFSVVTPCTYINAGTSNNKGIAVAQWLKCCATNQKVAVSIIHEALAPAEVTDTLLCILTLDFREAFDRIGHDYLFTILKSYVICPWFIDRIKDLYENAMPRYK